MTVANNNWQIENGLHLANQKQETIASRKVLQNSIEYFVEFLPEFIGGSADLLAQI